MRRGGSMRAVAWDKSPRVVFLDRWRSFGPLNNDALSPRPNFSYLKLPQKLVKLSVLKLDGSSFDIQIEKTASIGKLKRAVEDVFTQSPKDGQGKISWSHVWGHFCLCYEGQKLVNNKAYIRSFGIKDGDQLHFIRHLSINYRPRKRQSKNRCADCKHHIMSIPGSDVCEEKEGSGGDDDNSEDLEENDRHHFENDDNKDFIGHPEFKLSHFMRGWISNSGLWCAGRTKSEVKVRPSRFPGHFL